MILFEHRHPVLPEPDIFLNVSITGLSESLFIWGVSCCCCSSFELGFLSLPDKMAPLNMCHVLSQSHALVYIRCCC